MLNNVLDALALIAFVLIIRWYIVNADKGQDNNKNDGSIGVPAMKTGEEKTPSAARSSVKDLFSRRDCV